MKYLVDTHILLWWLGNEKRLKNSVKDILADPDNIVYVSVASAWELSIKLLAKSRFRLKTTIEECFQKSGFQTLDITLSHVSQLQKLANHHKDPFDRMLIAQAQIEGATLITGDEKIWKYNVEVLRT